MSFIGCSIHANGSSLTGASNVGFRVEAFFGKSVCRAVQSQAKNQKTRSQLGR